MKRYENKYVLVTGGAGFIGSNLVHLLGEEYPHLILVDNLGKKEKWKNLVGKRFLDLIHKDKLFEWLIGKEKEIGAIIHLGACSSTTETDANYLLENNFHTSQRLAEFALKNGVRFIYASSAATYGDGRLGFNDDHALLEELRPLNMYGYSKHLFDLWLKKEGVLDKVVGLKYFNIFGPNEYHKEKMASPLLKMVADGRSKREISLFKSYDPHYQDGGQLRDFLYVKDAVRMTAQFLNNDVGGIFNIGAGVARSWNDLAKAAISSMQLPIQIVYVEMPQELMGKYQNYTCAEMKKVKDLHLLMPQYTLEAAVKEYIQEFLLSGKTL